MNDILEREIENATQEAASIRNLREEFMALAASGDKAAHAHVRLLEKRELEAREAGPWLHV